MSLLDQNFSDQCKPVINSLERLPDIVNGWFAFSSADKEILLEGEGDVTMMFSESSLVRNIFSKMSEISVIYTVQIVPRTDKAGTSFKPHSDYFFISGLCGSGGL